MTPIIFEFGTVGLCRLRDDDTFELVSGGEKFKSERIYTILPYDDKVLIGARNEGFFLYDGQSSHHLKPKR